MVNLVKLDSLEKESVREYAYRVLRYNIISFKLLPGMSMSEKEISEILSISRTPVREAFIRLSQEGLLDILPQRGTYVSKIDSTQISEFRFFRETLEIAVMRLACDQFSENGLKCLQQNLNEQKKAINQKNGNRFYSLDNEFHKIIFEGCQKSGIWNMIQDSNLNYIRTRVLDVAGYNNQQEMNLLYEQHKKILDCISNHKEAEGMKIVQEHINKVMNDIESLKKTYSEYFK